MTITVLTTVYSLSVFTTTSFQSQHSKNFFVQASSSTIATTTTIQATTKPIRSMTKTEKDTLSFLDDLRGKYQHQPTFLQAVEEMAQSLTDLFDDPNDGEFYKRAFLMIAEPERMISFRVTWMDDQGHIQSNRGWRVEFNR